jgi:hypothetical protein
LLFTNGFSLFEFIIKVSVALSLLMTLLLLIALTVIRYRNGIYRRRQAVLTTRWRGVFKTAYTGEAAPNPLPAIERGDWFTVLCLYVQFHDIREKDRPRSAEVFRRLDACARRVGIDDYAFALLLRGDDAEKILALNILGQLHDRRATGPAIALTSADGPELSRAAAQCVLRIDASSIGSTLQLILLREDWVRSRVEAMLGEIDPEALGQAMRVALGSAPDAVKPRLLDFVRLCSTSTARAICADVLTAALDPETIAAALRSLAPIADERDHELAMRYCTHTEGIVVLSALRVLRKCVRSEDRALLEQLTSHRSYWVRLRAAEASIALFGTSDSRDFAAQLTDPYARDAIRQILAEQALFAGRAAQPDRRMPRLVEKSA